jgi:hypothetical protein
MLHVFKGKILANMTQVSDVAPGPLVLMQNTIVFVNLCKFFDGFQTKALRAILRKPGREKNHNCLLPVIGDVRISLLGECCP